MSDIEAASSGKLVPIATNVKPISSCGTPTMRARFLAPKTSVSEPSQRVIVANTIIKIDTATVFEFS